MPLIETGIFFAIRGRQPNATANGFESMVTSDRFCQASSLREASEGYRRLPMKIVTSRLLSKWRSLASSSEQYGTDDK